MFRLLCFAAVALCLAIAADSYADSWPQFRGAHSQNVGTGEGLPDAWGADTNIAWRTEIAGLGWGSPIVWGDRVFVTSVTNEGEREQVRKGLYPNGNRPDAPTDIHHWTVHCLDLETGARLWEREVRVGPPPTARHLKNTYASETPATDGERLYAYFGNVGLFVFDMEGNEVWSKQWKPEETVYGWGTAASPILHGERVYVINDNEGQSYLTALDKRTGEEIWRIDRDERSSWATPYIWENEIRSEIITAASGKVRSYDLDGNLLWELTGMSQIAIPQPFSDGGLLYVTSGYVMDRMKPVWAIRAGASGDITLLEGETSNEFIVWYQHRAGPYNPTPVVYEGRYYTLLDMGFLTCHDAKTGREIYGKQRLGKGGTSFSSSPWAYDGKIFCLSEDGDTYVVEAGDEYKLLGTNSLDELCMATPALLDDSLILRSASAIYRIGKSGE